MAVHVGIDLGTTNSCVAVWEHGQPRMVINERGGTLTPSALWYDSRRQRLVVGETAYRKPNAALRFKRLMGTGERLSVGGKVLSPEESSSLILRQLKEDVERYLRTAVDDVVITVPANWKDTQRRATWTAGRLAGLNVTRLINEPTAAAMAYGLRPDADGKTVAVYDLGGGTFDITILKIRGRIFDVLTSEGDDRLGGMDFDAKLLRLALKTLQAQYGYVLPPPAERSPELMVRLRGLELACETTKKELSFEGSAELVYPFLDTVNGRPLGVEVEIERDQFEALIEGDIQRTIKYMNKALRDAELAPDAVDEVVLVGGSTRIPLVRQRVAELIGKEPLTAAVNPDEAVALGAAIQAAIVGEGTTEDPPIVLDIVTSSLGVEVAREIGPGQVEPGFFSPIITRGKKLPAAGEDQYTTVADNQETVVVRCYEGEHHLARQNKPIGQPIEITGLPARPAGEVKINVKFSYDLSQLLHVSVDVPGSGLHAEENFQLRRGTLSEEEIHRKRQELDAFAAGGGAAGEAAAEKTHQSGEPWESSHLAPRYRGVIQRAEETLAAGPDPRGTPWDDLARTLEELKAAVARGDAEKAEELDLKLTDILFDIMM